MRTRRISTDVRVSLFASRSVGLSSLSRDHAPLKLHVKNRTMHVMWLSGRISLRDHISPCSCTDTAQFAVLKRSVLFLSSLLMVGRQQIQHSGNHDQ